MSSSGTVRRIRRSRARRAGESAYGLLLLVRNLMVALVALLVVVAGTWESWGDAAPAMRPAADRRGTVAVTECDGDWCTGAFSPKDEGGRARDRVRVDEAVVDVGDRVDVVLKPGGHEAVRTGATGILHAWVPLGGALLLAALLVAGGLRMRRTGWGLGLAGAAVLCGSFATLVW